MFFMLVLSATMLCASAQTTNDPVIFEIGGKPIYKSQFMKDFLKSIGQDPAASPTACTYEKRKALEDYVQLYVNFQSKLADAYAMGLDTVSSLCDELGVYRKELAAPYLIDSATMQGLLREAYERNHYALHAAHILVPCPETATPADTLKAYNHAVELYQKALTMDFYKLAQQEMYDQRVKDQDPLVREKATQVNPYEGELGCFTVFDMVYPFETAAYSMKPGEVSGPVRSRYGYHIIKLFDRYEYFGKSQFAHIWIAEKDPNARGKAYAAYKLLQEGEDFGLVARNNSDDNSTSKTGGVMPELACNQLPVEYVEVVAKKGLKVGEVSEPFHTRYGWHIVKLLKKDSMPDFESMVPYYKSRMTRGERSTKPQHIFVAQCKEKYNFVDYTKVKASKKKKAPYMASLEQVRSLITDTIFSGRFSYDSNQITDMRPLFRIGDRQYNSRQFARYLRINKKIHRPCDLDVYLNERYMEFVDAKVLEYADSRLEQDNPEFGELINEYRHGLMIFAYNDKAVWSQSLKDSAGFKAFYDRVSPQHSYDDTNDAVYFWNHRARVAVVTIDDSACLKPSKAEKIVRKGVEKGWSLNSIKDALLDKVSKKKCTAEEPVTVELQLVEVGNQNLLTNNEWSKGIYPRSTEKGYRYLIVEQVLQPELKTLEEARGFYLDAYQNYLEAKNNAALREKYNVKIHQDVIDEITY